MSHQPQSGVPAPPLTQRLADTMVDVGRSGAQAFHRVTHAVEYARGPGRPLDIISTVAKKAPLSSLLVTFVLGMMFARRR